MIKDLAAKKSFGQNFLVREDILDAILAAAQLTPSTHVIEIGPGPGSLTRWILHAGPASLTVIEKDTRMAAFLEPLLEDGDGVCPVGGGPMILRFGDALDIPFWDMGGVPRVVVANLPYNVATPLLLKMLENRRAFSHMVLMFQKEVAERLLASPSTSAYGRLSVLSQLLCRVEHVITVPPSAFSPSPKVMSMVVKLTPYAAPRFTVDVPHLQALLHHVFQQRRKMLRASLKGFVRDPLEILKAAGVEPTLRPENLTLEAFCALARQSALDGERGGDSHG